MINTVVKLTSPKNFELFFREEELKEEHVIIRPTYLSICAADQRYYQGKRKKEILDKKLPLTLIHEGVGIVHYDKTGEFQVGEKVVMIPNLPFEENEVIKENYLRSSKFRSSSYDGYMQNVVSMRRDRIIPIKNIDEAIASQLELTSVAVNAVENFIKKSHQKIDKIGVWGCGSVGYILALVLKRFFPQSKIIVIGTCAGIDTKYKNLDIFVPNKVVQYDCTVKETEPLIKDSFTICFDISNIPEGLQTGTLGTADKPVVVWKDYLELQENDITIADTETAAIAYICKANNVSCTIFRGISDFPIKDDVLTQVKTHQEQYNVFVKNIPIIMNNVLDNYLEFAIKENINYMDYEPKATNIKK